MVVVDMSVIVRFFVCDDEKQARAVYARLKRAEVERERMFVPLAVVLGTMWVLESAYSRSRTEILDSIQEMRQMHVFEFERDEVIERVVTEGRDNTADLADLLIAHSARCSGCESGLTFDRRAARLAFFSLLE